MQAIVVTDQAAGVAGMRLMDRPEPQPAINDVVVRVHASGFVGTELGWPSTWTDRLGHDRTPTIPGHELAGVVTAIGYGTTGTLAEYAALEAGNLAPLPVRSRPVAGRATCRRARRGRRSRVDGHATRKTGRRLRHRYRTRGRPPEGARPWRSRIRRSRKRQPGGRRRRRPGVRTSSVATSASVPRASFDPEVR
jgi:hypothetical protein